MYTDPGIRVFDHFLTAFYCRACAREHLTLKTEQDPVECLGFTPVSNSRPASAGDGGTKQTWRQQQKRRPSVAMKEFNVV